MVQAHPMRATLPAGLQSQKPGSDSKGVVLGSGAIYAEVLRHLEATRYEVIPPDGSFSGGYVKTFCKK